MAGQEGLIASPHPRQLPSFLGAAAGDMHASSARGLRPRPLPARSPLTSRHAGAHHGAAGPGRCALGASGRRALMSPRPRTHARRGRSRRAGGEGAAAALGSAAAPPCCPRRRRRLPLQLLPAPRAGGPPGPLAPSPERGAARGRPRLPSPRRRRPAHLLPRAGLGAGRGVGRVRGQRAG